jgi:hypothetical protein
MRPGRADRIILTVVAVAAAAIGAVTLIAGALRIRLYVAATVEGGSPVSLLANAPVPGVPTDADTRIVFGAYPTADLRVTGLSQTTRLLLAIGEGVGVLVAAIVSAVIAWALIAISRGRPFARPLWKLSVIAGATLSIGSLLGQGLAGFGSMNAAVELNAVSDELFGVGFALDLAPIAIGFVIMALAFVFRAGAHLQRETEGLV